MIFHTLYSFLRNNTFIFPMHVSHLSVLVSNVVCEHNTGPCKTLSRETEPCNIHVFWIHNGTVMFPNNGWNNWK